MSAKIRYSLACSEPRREGGLSSGHDEQRDHDNDLTLVFKSNAGVKHTMRHRRG